MANNVKAGGAYVELFTKDSALISGLNAASKRLKDFGGKVAGIGARMAAVGTVAGGALVAAAMRFADAGGAIDDAAQRTGTSAEAFSALAYAAKMAGTDAETLEKSLIKLNQGVADLGAGSETAKKAFGALGLSIADLQGLSPDEQMALIADRLAAIPDTAQRTAAAMDIFGTSGARLLPMLAGGAAGLEEMRAEAERLGLVMSSEDAQSAAALGDAMDKLTGTIDRAWQAVGAALAPALTQIAEVLTGVMVGVRKWIDENRELIVMVAAGVAAFTALGAALVALGGAIAAAGVALGAIASVLTMVGAAIGFLLSPIGLVVGGLATLGVAVWQTSDASGKAIQWFGEQFGALQEDSLSAFRAIADALAAGDIGTAAETLWNYLAAVWESGKLLIFEISNELTNGLIDIWFNASTALVTTAIQVTGAISDAWLSIGDIIRSFWIDIFTWFENKFTWLKYTFKAIAVLLSDPGFVMSNFGLGEISPATDAEVERLKQELQNETDNANAAAEAAKATGTDFATRQAERSRLIGGVEAGMGAARDAFGNPLEFDTTAQRRRVETTREQFRSGARETAGRNRADMPGMGERPKIGPPPDLEAAKQAARITATGTFSAQAVGGIGGPAERTAQNTEEMKRTLRRMEEAGLGAFA